MAKNAGEKFIVNRVLDDGNYGMFVCEGRPAAVTELEHGLHQGATFSEDERGVVRGFLEGRSIAELSKNGTQCGRGNPVFSTKAGWIGAART